MRHDMKKLLCEEPRHGGQYAKPGRGYRSYDDMPHRQGMSMRSRAVRWNGKEFGEHLGPLKRFVDKQLGRHWDKVFSEICDAMGSGQTPVESHIFEHLEGYIDINVQRCSTAESRTGLISHRVLGSGYKYGSRRPVSIGSLYVCPDTKIIKRAKSLVKDKPKVVKNNFRKLTSNRVALKIKGVWYSYRIVTVKHEKQWNWYPAVDPDHRSDSNRNFRTGWYSNIYRIAGDSYLSIPLNMNIAHLIGENPWRISQEFGHDIAVIEKAQMTTHELRQNNLKNDR